MKIPGELEIDFERGVIYFHSTITGTSVLRICRIDSEKLDELWRKLSPDGTNCALLDIIKPERIMVA